MDLKALHSLMSRKKFHYFGGQTNDRENNLYLSFSTLHNGRGDSVEIRIGDADNDINFILASAEVSDYVSTEMKNISDNEIFLAIEATC